MYRITGSIQEKGTNRGLGNIKVVFYDYDNFSDPENPRPLGPVLTTTTTNVNTLVLPEIDFNRLHAEAGRVGSVITDEKGHFSLELEDSDFNTGNESEKKPDLIFAVLAPEEPGLKPIDRLLYLSNDFVLNAGHHEAFLVRLETELVKKHGLLPIEPVSASVPVQPPDPLVSLEAELIAKKAEAHNKQKILKTHLVLEQEKHVKKRTETFTQPLLQKLSAVPESFKVQEEGQKIKRFIPRGDAITSVVRGNMEAELLDASDPPAPVPKTVKGYIYLSKDEKTDFQDKDLTPNDEFYDLPDHIVKEKVLSKLFRKTENGSSTDFLMDHPAARKYRQIKKEEQSTAPDEDGTTPAGDQDDKPQITEQAILEFVYNQLSTATSPEQELTVGLKNLSLEKTAKRDELENTIKKAIFQKGPADIPAYHEFHQLKIAFENVWQEALDLGLIDKAEKWYDLASAAGGESSNMTIINGQIYLGGFSIPGQNVVKPEPGVILEFPEALEFWDRMNELEKTTLNKLSQLILGKYKDDSTEGVKSTADYHNFFAGGNAVPAIDVEHLVKNSAFDAVSTFILKGKTIVEAAKERILNAENLLDEYNDLRSANSLRDEINAHLNSKYSFKYYAADKTERSVNFGILLTYQQKWQPLDYQAGELVKTIPLAPKEVRKYSRKTVVKKHRSQKEQEENVRITKSSTSETSRAETEIISKAHNKVSSESSNESKVEYPIGPISLSGSMSLKNASDAQKDSQQTKKAFHEAVRSASHEYTQTHKTEVVTDLTYEDEFTESGEIMNPNDELSVTFLFYELQRRFRISEKLYRLRPVILVAQEMPAPHEIDMEWVLTNDWIIKRVLLDDSFRFGLDAIYNINGEKLLISELERAVRDQRQIIKDLRQNVRFYNEEVGKQNRLLQLAISREISSIEGHSLFGDVPFLGSALDGAEGRLKKIGSFFGMDTEDGDQNKKEAARIRREGANAAFERAERERKELLGRLEAEVAVLNNMTKELAAKRKEIILMETHIAQLLAHLKNYILHYMQAIWHYEHKDQRYFRLLDTKVPIFEGDYSIKIKKGPEPENLNDYAVRDKTRHEYELTVSMKVKDATLKEIANLDNCLGYKGNYMIFDLNQSNILTDFMMAPYIDTEFGLSDPDNLGNWSLEEFEEFREFLKKEMGDEFSTIEENIKKIHAELLQDPLRNGDIIPVPTDSLFITSLVDEHSIVEKFKALHRMEDVKGIQAVNRGKELENLRYAMRIINKQLDDPQIDKKIIVDSKVETNLDPEN